MTQGGISSSRPAGSARPIRVLIVDDSAVVRELLTRELSRDPMIQVVATAPDPYIARDRIIEHSPDVVTLDVEMPRMDGLTFLRHLMRARPIPVIVLSSLTDTGTQTAIDALNAGAVDVLAKPGSSYTVGAVGAMLIARIKAAASARVRPAPTSAIPVAAHTHLETTHKVIAIGASTGGVQALTQVIGGLPRTSPGVVVVQHMPERFTASFAQRLATLCQVVVKEAANGDRVVPGRVLIAPGGWHMVLRRSGAEYLVHIKAGPEVFHQRPSVEVLFNSVAEAAGANAVGCLLTGMGVDGASGLLAIRDAGGRTIAQDEATCVVFGMPGQAVKMGAVEQLLPLPEIAHALLHASASPAGRAPCSQDTCRKSQLQEHQPARPAA